MRGATECAKRVKHLFNSLRSQLGKVTRPAVGDPVTQMLLGILSRNVPEHKAVEALERLRGTVVDYNELRVVPPLELTETLGEYPDARAKGEDIARALNAIFAVEHSVTLDHLTELGKKEALAYLEKIEGLEAYTLARVRLVGLGQHAFPLDEAMWALARREELVAPKAELAECQQFLERIVSEDDALEFYCLLKKHAWSEMASAVRKGEVERIQSVPPDRTSRNMLQAIMASSGTLVLPEDLELEPDALLPEPVELPAKSDEGRRKTKPARPAKAAAASAKPAPAAAAGKPAKPEAKPEAKPRRAADKPRRPREAKPRRSSEAAKSARGGARKPAARSKARSTAKAGGRKNPRARAKSA